MKNKVIAGLGALAFCGAMSSGIAQTATESRQTTVEESRTVVDAPKPRPDVREETTTTTTKKGLFGRKKETTRSTTRYEGNDPANGAEVRSRTTVDTERRSRE